MADKDLEHEKRWAGSSWHVYRSIKPEHTFVWNPADQSTLPTYQRPAHAEEAMSAELRGGTAAASPLGPPALCATDQSPFVAAAATVAVPAAAAWEPTTSPISIAVCKGASGEARIVYVLQTASGGTEVVPGPSACCEALANAERAGHITRTASGNYKIAGTGVRAPPPTPPRSPPPPPDTLPATPPQPVRAHTAATVECPCVTLPSGELSWLLMKKRQHNWPCIAFRSKAEAERRLRIMLEREGGESTVDPPCPSGKVLLFFLGTNDCAYTRVRNVCNYGDKHPPSGRSSKLLQKAVNVANELKRQTASGLPCLICAHSCPGMHALDAHVRTAHASEFNLYSENNTDE